MDLKIFEELGFTKVETEIYLQLVKHDELSASEIATKVKISRTYVYDALEHLLEKGVINYVLKNNRKKFKCLDYSKLIDFIENKKRTLDAQKKEVKDLILEFKSYEKKETNVPRVEVLEGAEGLKTVLNDIVKTGKDVVGWGAADVGEKYLPKWFIERYVNEKVKKNIKTTQLYGEGKIPLKGKGYRNKKVPKEVSGPVTFGSYGNKTVIFFWGETPMTIRVDNKEIADSFKKHFKFLWKKF
jgi:sugar-specific transcriptional regulator TrmB